MQEEEVSSHESFGQIRFSRCNANGTRFYGSELPQDHFISMEVSRSEFIRGLADDRYYSKEKILSIRMSSSQFAEMITSMNYGSGTPCTIERVQGKKMADLPNQESRKEFVHRKFEDRMKEFGDKIRERQQRAKELVRKKTLSKEDVRQLQIDLDWLTVEVERNIPFFAKCFQETMDEVVHEAKTEVENAIQHKINVLGLAALHEQNKLIENK